MAELTWENTQPIDHAQPSELTWENTQELAPADAAATSPVTTATTGLMNPLGWGPTLGALGQTGMDAVTGLSGPLAGKGLDDLVDEYRHNRDNLRKDFAKAAAAHPVISAVSNMASNAAALAPLGAAAMTPGGLAATGAVQGLGGSDIDSASDILPAAKNAAMGAGVNLAVGTATKAAAQGLGKLAGKASDYLGGRAEDLAVKATGATGKQAAEFAPETGRELIDRGIVGFGDSPGDIALKANQAIDQSGEDIGSALKELDDQGVTVDRKTVLDYIKGKIAALSSDESQADLARALKRKARDIQATIKPGEQSPYGPPKQIGMELPEPFSASNPTGPNRGRIMQVAGDIRQANIAAANDAGYNPYKSQPIEMNSEIPISQAENIKRGFQSKVNWKSPDLDNNANAAVSDVYRKAVENSAGEASPEIAEQFLKDKNTYGLLKPVAEAAEKRQLQLSQSPHGGLLDMAAAGAGAAVGGPVGAIAGLGAKALRPRYASMGAIAADRLSDILKSSPTSFGEFAGMLQSAAARGGSSLGATDYILQQTNPKYRATRQQIFDPNEQESQEKILADQ